jgi:cobalt/nickel transport protein
MSRRTWLFAGAALGLSLLVAGVLSPFASSSPDGLERVALDKGFSEKGEAEAAWKWSPLAGYEIHGFASQRLAGACAGVLGTTLVFGAAYAVARLSKAGRRGKGPVSPAVREVP